jgi:hypothetical protein
MQFASPLFCLVFLLLQVVAFGFHGGNFLSFRRRSAVFSQMELNEENLQIALSEARAELGTLFGYDAKSREVGITGTVEIVDMDGPSIYVALNGRFWHPTDTVLARVQNFMKKRIPEITEVLLSPTSKIIDDNRMNSANPLNYE